MWFSTHSDSCNFFFNNSCSTCAALTTFSFCLIKDFYSLLSSHFAALKMSWFWLYLPLHLLTATCLCHSIKASTTSSQQSFKADLFNFYHSLVLADGKETTIHLLKDIPKRWEQTSHSYSQTLPCVTGSCTLPGQAQSPCVPAGLCSAPEMPGKCPTPQVPLHCPEPGTKPWDEVEIPAQVSAAVCGVCQSSSRADTAGGLQQQTAVSQQPSLRSAATAAILHSWGNTNTSPARVTPPKNQ